MGLRDSYFFDSVMDSVLMDTPTFRVGLHAPMTSEPVFTYDAHFVPRKGKAGERIATDIRAERADYVKDAAEVVQAVHGRKGQLVIVRHPTPRYPSIVAVYNVRTEHETVKKTTITSAVD